MIHNIPQELVDAVVCEVAADGDKPTRLSALTACSLTSWSFFSPARKGLFGQITLIEDAGDDTDLSVKARSKLEELLQLIEDDPCRSYPNQTTLPKHIKSLIIQFSSLRTLQKMHNTSPGNQKQSLLPVLLDLIPNARELNLSFGSNEAHNAWPYIDDSLKEKLVHFCTSRPIHKMQFGHIDRLPLTLITSCPKLKALSMHFTKLDPDNHPQASEPLSVLSYLCIAGAPLVLGQYLEIEHYCH